MDIAKLSEADKYLLYGLLLRKKRPAEAEKRVLSIIRSPLTLDRKIDAILALHRKLADAEPGAEAATVTGEQPAAQQLAAELPAPEPPAAEPFAAGGGARRARAVVADPHAELTRLLAKSSLRRELEFFQAADRRQALALVRRLRARLVVCNLQLEAGGEAAFALECRKRQPTVRLIFLHAQPLPQLPDQPVLQGLFRVLPKPINLNQLAEAARALLGP